MEGGGGRTLASWSSAGWRASALAWIDERLAAAGLERTGEPEQTHLRPWATVLRVPVARGRVWFKAAGPGTAFEPALNELLARVAPDRVLTPIATDTGRAWILLPDGGPTLGERLAGDERAAALADALAAYGRFQLELEPHAGELVGLGVPDMRPEAMPARFEEALAAALRSGLGDAARARLEALRPAFAEWCERLAASPLRPSLDHNDLHPWNVLDGPRYYDWGDSVVAHPFAALLVPLEFLARELGAGADDRRVRRLRDAYLEPFTGRAPRAELAEALAVARRVATVARALTWERAIGAAREQGFELDRGWRSAPAETLASLLDGE